MHRIPISAPPTIRKHYAMMLDDPVIRDEGPADAEAVEVLVARAFKDHPHSMQTEHLIARELLTAGALVFPKVAVLAGAIIGYATFSRVQLNPEYDGWYGLGPVAVAPERQGRGIGSALITEGLASLKRSGAVGCVVLDKPEFYQRFGFERVPELAFAAALPEYFLTYAFKEPLPSSAVSYHPAFSITG